MLGERLKDAGSIPATSTTTTILALRPGHLSRSVRVRTSCARKVRSLGSTSTTTEAHLAIPRPEPNQMRRAPIVVVSTMAGLGGVLALHTVVAPKSIGLTLLGKSTTSAGLGPPSTTRGDRPAPTTAAPTTAAPTTAAPTTAAPTTAAPTTAAPTTAAPTTAAPTTAAPTTAAPTTAAPTTAAPTRAPTRRPPARQSTTTMGSCPSPRPYRGRSSLMSRSHLLTTAGASAPSRSTSRRSLSSNWKPYKPRAPTSRECPEQVTRARGSSNLCSQRSPSSGSHEVQPHRVRNARRPRLVGTGGQLARSALGRPLPRAPPAKMR